MFPTPRFPTPRTADDTIDTLSSQNIIEGALGADSFYPPSEDTFLFLDALDSEARYIYLSRPALILEIGSGSGCVVTHLQLILKSLNRRGEEFGFPNLAPHCFAIDVNHAAAKATVETAVLNCVNNSLDVILGDIFCSFRYDVVIPEFFGFDIILFNPPYVPSEEEENFKRDITACWAGGKSGRNVIDGFIALLPKILSLNGYAYLLIEERNRPEEIIQSLEELKFMCKAILQRKIRMETLRVLKIWRNHT